MIHRLIFSRLDAEYAAALLILRHGVRTFA